jgi:membrane-associated protease RseP (regulator of RpoE activity)
MLVMCSRVLKGMVLLAALGMAMVVGAVLGGSAVYLVTRETNAHPAIEIRTGDLDPWLGLLPGIPHGVPVPMWGAVVLVVAEDSPASAAGLREGDVIVALDGEPVLGPGSLAATIAERAPGDEVELTVYQLAGSVRRTIEVTLGEHPAREDEAYLGVWLDSDFVDVYSDLWRE